MTFVKTTPVSPYKLSGFFQDSHNRLLLLWRALLFLVIFAGLFFLIGPLMPLVPSAYRPLTSSILFSIIGIGLTWLFVKKEGSNLAAAGFKLNRKWIEQLFVGILPGIPVALLIIWMEGVFFGTSLAFNKNLQWPAYLFLLYGVFWSAFFQEVFFRGYIFQTMLKQWGHWKAQVAMAVIFSLFHMQAGPFVMVTTFFFSFLYGLAYIRTGRLALPVGLHTGFILGTVSFGTAGGPAQLFVRTIPDTSPLMTSSFIMLLPTVLVIILCCVALYFYKRKRSIGI